MTKQSILSSLGLILIAGVSGCSDAGTSSLGTPGASGYGVGGAPAAAGGTDPGYVAPGVGGSTAAGGAVANTGGAVANTGGAVANTGGSSPAAGGSNSGAGGSQAGSGGNPGTAVGQGVPACGDEGGAYGVQVGDVMENFTFPDQNGNMVSLSDFCDKVVYIAVANENCGVCSSHANEYEERYAHYGGEVVFIDVISDVNGIWSNSGAAAWASEHKFVNAIAVDDAESDFYNRFPGTYSWWDGSTGHALLLKKGGVIHNYTDPDGAPEYRWELTNDHIDAAIAASN